MASEKSRRNAGRGRINTTMIAMTPRARARSPRLARPAIREPGVMPSKSKYFGVEFEGLGLVYLEAASYGLPVIVGASGGAIETIIPGKTGFVAGDKNILKESILYFLNNPEKIQEFGLNGRKFVEEFYSWEKLIMNLDSNIESIK